MRRRHVLMALAALAWPSSVHAQREISATLEVRRDEMTGDALVRRIPGVGHSHEVRVEGAALAGLWDQGVATVRSGPAPDGHRHWVRVRVRESAASGDGPGHGW